MTADHARAARLFVASAAGVLPAAFFVDGISWPSVLRIDPERGAHWWRESVSSAHALGLLTWSAKRLWVLTPSGFTLLVSLARGLDQMNAEPHALARRGA